MRLPLYQVDAFSHRVFGGNPAAVVPLRNPLPDETMQAIASENNVSETAFFHPVGGYGGAEGLRKGYEQRGGNVFALRWFTPTTEVDLCGHATLASGFVIFLEQLVDGHEVHFETQSGRLTVQRDYKHDGNLLSLDFPTRPPQPLPEDKLEAEMDALTDALGARPELLLKARDHMAVFRSEEDIAALKPSFKKLAKTNAWAVAVTAPGKEVDFVSRFFAPKVGVNEDPVTGSAHCTLVPYWAERLSKTELKARQTSYRGGELVCGLEGDRVRIAGRAVLYLRGEISV